MLGCARSHSTDITRIKLKEDGSVTLDKPPNHKSFNALSTGNLAPKSLLQRRQQAASNPQGVPQASTQIHNHFSIPDALLGFLSNTLPGPTNTPTVVSNSQMLLSIAQPSGPKLSITLQATTHFSLGKIASETRHVFPICFS
jgi:hypothetical protein